MIGGHRMKDYTFTQQFALIGLNGLDSLHSSTAKTAVMRGIVAAKFLESNFDVLESGTTEKFEEAWKKAEGQIRKLDKKTAKSLEQEVTTVLKAMDVLDEVQDILACDMNFDSANVNIKVYRADMTLYQRIVESIRAEILEEGEITAECFGFLWLMRESCCIHDFFSIEEQKYLEQRILNLKPQKPNYAFMWEQEFHKSLESLALRYLRGKSNLFKNPYLQGVNLLFPFLERRQAIFIDFVVLGTTVASRRMAVMEYLSQRGHYVEEVKMGTETLLKIDNHYYRIFPATRSVRIPIQGIDLVPVYK